MACGIPPIAANAHGPARSSTRARPAGCSPRRRGRDGRRAGGGGERRRASASGAARPPSRRRARTTPGRRSPMTSPPSTRMCGAVTSVPYRIRRSPRARVARINVSPDGVEVVVPRRFPEREVEPFVREKSAWIERTLRRLPSPSASSRRRASRTAARCPTWASGWCCACASSPGAGVRTSSGAATCCEVALPAAGDLRDALERWYRRRAAAEIAPRLDAACARAGRVLRPAHDPRPAHPLGQLLLERRDELQLAAAAGAGGDPRLRGRARGGPPRGPRPLRAASGRCSPRAARTGASTRRGCGATGTSLRLRLVPAEEAHREQQPGQRPAEHDRRRGRRRSRRRRSRTRGRRSGA